MVKVNLQKRMVTIFRAVGTMIYTMDQEYDTKHLQAVRLAEHGSRVSWRDQVDNNGMMVPDLMEHIAMISNMDMED
jgi:hypothetical protein